MYQPMPKNSEYDKSQQYYVYCNTILFCLGMNY